MTKQDLAAIVRGIGPVLGEYFSIIGQRLSALEAKEKGLDGKPGKDGERGPVGPEGQPGRDGRDGQPGTPGTPGMDGKDGRDGNHGKDGAPGLDGKDGANGKDGAPGLNGKDGFGFDDLDVVFDDMNGYRLRFQRGDQVKEFPIGIAYDAGPWRADRVYHKGAGVMAKGCYWVALETVKARPGDESHESRKWRLTVKCGRDGKPGRDGRNGSDT